MAQAAEAVWVFYFVFVIARVALRTAESYPPPPDSVRRFLIFNELREGCVAKILSALELAADSSQQRS